MKEITLIFFTTFIIPLLLVWCIMAGVKSTYKFEVEDVRPQLELVLNTKDFKVVEQSNNSVWFGKPSDVTYNIMMSDSTVVSCRCTDSVFQPRICRKYQ